MVRFLFTPNDYSPTYDVESDGNRNFVALHAVYDIPPGYPEAKAQEIEQHHVDYMRGDGWRKLIAHRDALGLLT